MGLRRRGRETTATRRGDFSRPGTASSEDAFVPATLDDLSRPDTGLRRRRRKAGWAMGLRRRGRETTATRRGDFSRPGKASSEDAFVPATPGDCSRPEIA